MHPRLQPRQAATPWILGCNPVHHMPHPRVPQARGGPLRNKAGQALGSGEQAVSWHADSSLEPFSSIAVLNLSLPQGGKGGKGGGKGGGGKHDKEPRGKHGRGGKGGKGGGKEPERGGKGGKGGWGGGWPWRIAMKCVGAEHEPTDGSVSTPALAAPLERAPTPTTTPHHPSSPLTTPHHPSPPLTTPHRPSPPLTAPHHPSQMATSTTC